MAAAHILDPLAVLLCAAATFTDLKSYRIPNRLTLSALPVGLFLSGLLPLLGFASHPMEKALALSFVGAVVGLVVFSVFWGLRMMGMGDVKLVAAVGAFVAWPLMLHVIVYTLLCGGVLSFGYAVARGQTKKLFRVRPSAEQKRDGVTSESSGRIPYAAAILAGTLWAVLARHIPELLLF